MTIRSWDKRWLQMAEVVASWSKDPNTKVGCVIVDDRQNLLVTGWNGIPRGVEDESDLRNEKPEKYKWYEHAERNAIYNAAAKGSTSLRGSTLYTTLFPCCDCMRGVIQSGITRVVVSYSNVDRQDTDGTSQSIKMAEEAGIKVEIYSE